jgi:hypothetical protein
MRLGLVIILITITSFLVAFILNRIFNNKRYIKYILVIILVSLMLYNFVTMNSPSNEGFEDLGKFVMGIFLLAASMSSLISSVAFDIIHKHKNRIK